VIYRIREDPRAVNERGRRVQRLPEVRAVEDVVAEHQRTRFAGDELLADQQRVRDAARRCLLGVRQPDPPLGSVQIVGRRDHEDVPDAGEEQRRQRVVDHRLVEHRKQVLRDRACERIQPRAAPTGQDDAFHAITSRPA
jgi:hypothetical protein